MTGPKRDPFDGECGWPAWICPENESYTPCDKPCPRREAEFKRWEQKR